MTPRDPTTLNPPSTLQVSAPPHLSPQSEKSLITLSVWTILLIASKSPEVTAAKDIFCMAFFPYDPQTLEQ